MTTRKTFARRTAIIASTALLAGGAAAPAAQAQNLGGLLGTVGIISEINDAAIANLDCKTTDTILTTLKLKDATTTKSQLEKNIRNAVPAANAGIVFIKAEAAGKWADRALECGIVKADPQTPLSGSTELLGSLDVIQELIAVQR